MIYIIRTLVLTLVEVLCCRIFFDTFLKRKEQRHHMDKVVLLAMWIGSIGIACISDIKIRIVIGIGLFFGAMRILYRGMWIQVFVFTIAEFALCLLSEGCVQFFLQYILQIDKSDLWPSNSIVIPILGKMMSLLCIIVLYKRYGYKGHMRMLAGKEWIHFLIFPLLAMVLVCVMLKGKEDIAMMLSAMGLLVADFLFFYFMQSILRKEEILQEKQLEEIQAKNQIQLYQSMEDIYNIQQKKNHDFKNHMVCIQGLLETGENEKALKYLKELSGDWGVKDISINTNHAIINSVLRQKYVYAEQKGAQLILNVQNLQKVTVEDEDLVIILANLIDNAIEACERLKLKERRIRLRIQIEGEELQISTQNPIETVVKKENGNFITSKKNEREHGIGMKNIQRIVEKYNGEEYIQCENGYFTHTIIIEMMGE